jgi:Zn-dependent protease
VYSIETTERAVRPSPIFLGLLVVTAVGGWLTTTDLIRADVAVFVFVLAAWILSVTLHEFAHAFVAWRGGDRGIQQRGYLTLDPRKYAHPVLSIILPIVFIMLGYLPLPGGAVLINRAALNDGQATLVALAGPFTNLAIGAVSLLAVSREIIDVSTQPVLASAVAFFGFIQIAVFVLNMLPIPGLDGYAAIEPSLPPSTRELLRPVSQYAFLILFLLLIYVDPVSDAFWNAILFIIDSFGVERSLWASGYQFFEFWRNLG